jgi:ribosomal protein S18 acetylase RimI-like enzyme
LALGYREEMHETLMARALCDISPPDQAVPIVRVTSAEQADRLNATHVRQVIAQHELGDPAVRQYMIELDDQPAAWGRFVAIDPGAIYITSIRTAERYRRRGLARALMLRLMRDASEAGFTIGVLAASEMGVALYQTLGYVELAALVVFVPKETAQPT